MSSESGRPQPELFGKPGKAASWCWAHFGFLRNKDGKLDMQKAICRTCRNGFTYSNGSTGSLITHLRSAHGLCDPKHQSVKASPKVSTFFESAKPHVLSAARKEAIDKALMDFKILDLMPFDFVEGIGFRKFVGVLEPAYTVPCAKTMTARHAALFDSEQEELKADIKSSRPGSVSVTRDGWTPCNNKNYDCYTVHDITRDWQLRARAVALRETTGKKAEDIMGSIKSVTSEFGIVRPHITSDNCNAEAAGVNQSGNKRIECQAHIGNLAVQSGILQPVVAAVLDKVRSVCSWFKRSTGGFKVLLKKQTEKLPSELHGHSLKKDMVTRWDSTVSMTTRFLEQRVAIEAAAEDPEVVRLNPELQYELPEARDRNKLETLHEVLEPFKQATLTLSSDTEVTSSQAIPIAQILHNVTSVSHDDPDWLAEVKGRMSSNLNKWHTEDNESLKIASILDPNTRDFIVANKRELLLPLVEEVVEEKLSGSASESLSGLIPDCPPSVSQPEPPRKKRKFAISYDFIKQAHPMNNLNEDDAPLSSLMSKTPRSTALKEIDRYLAMPSSDMAPLDWWRIHEPEFPHIAEVARTYLAIMATSVPSERLWSVSGNVMTKKTARLSNKNLEAQVILHINHSKALKLKEKVKKRKTPDS